MTINEFYKSFKIWVFEGTSMLNLMSLAFITTDICVFIQTNGLNILDYCVYIFVISKILGKTFKSSK